MGWLFRQSFKIFPGIRLNLGKKGFTSAIIGKSPFSTNVGKLGARHAASIPGTALRYQTKTVPLRSCSPLMTQRLQTTWHCDRCGSLNITTDNFCGTCAQVKTAIVIHPQSEQYYQFRQPVLPTANDLNIVRNSWIFLLVIIACLIAGGVAVTSRIKNFSGS